MSKHQTPSPPALMMSATAGADLSTSQWLAVIPHTTADEIVVAGANAPTFLGILTDNPPSGSTGNYQKDGACPVITGAAFSLNDLLTTDSAGKMVLATTGQHVWAIARYVAALAGDEEVTVELGYRGLAA